MRTKRDKNRDVLAWGRRREAFPPPEAIVGEGALDSAGAESELVGLPVRRLEDQRRRLCGDVWAEPFPPAAAAMPINGSRLTGLIGKALSAAGAVVILLVLAGVIPAHHTGVTDAVVGTAGGVLALVPALLVFRERIDQCVVGVFADRRPDHAGWAIVALHPEPLGEEGYTRRPVVLRNLGSPPLAAATVWHQRLAVINQRAVAESADSYELLLEDDQ